MTQFLPYFLFLVVGYLLVICTVSLSLTSGLSRRPRISFLRQQLTIRTNNRIQRYLTLSKAIQRYNNAIEQVD